MRTLSGEFAAAEVVTLSERLPGVGDRRRRTTRALLRTLPFALLVVLVALLGAVGGAGSAHATHGTCAHPRHGAR